MALAAALVTRPTLVLLDEPTSQLDPVAGDELIWLLRRLNEEWGVTILLAEHRLERCLAAADRVIAMDSGAIAFDGSPRDFLAWAQRADAALETPAARLFSLPGSTRLPVGVRDARESSWQLGRAASIGRGGRLLADLSATAQAIRRSTKVQPLEGTPVPRQDRRSSVRDLWVELERDEERHDVLRGIDLDGRPGRARRADGPQRRRQEHAAADCRRAGRAGAGQGRGSRTGSRC